MQNKPSQGFSLIEILVVLFIMGITLSLTMYAFGDFGAQRKLIMSAEQLINQVTLVRQQAIVEGHVLRIGIEEHQYDVTRFDGISSWHPIKPERIFKAKTFPSRTRVTLKTADLSQRLKAIDVQPTGEMTPFVLLMGQEDKTSVIRVVGEANGELHLMINNEKSS